MNRAVFVVGSTFVKSGFGLAVQMAAAFLVTAPAVVQRVLPAGAASTEDGQWLMPAKDYASTRYSGLAEINCRTVKNLRPVIDGATGNARGHEAVRANRGLGD